MKPPSLPPTNHAPSWLLVILWLLPLVTLLLMAPVGFYWFYPARGGHPVLIVVVMAVIYLALLSVLAEINGRLRASGDRGSSTRRRHAALYFVIQLLAGPPVALAVIWVLALVGSM